MISQSWSPSNVVSPNTWQHAVDIYIPEIVNSQNALIAINDGTNYNINYSSNDPNGAIIHNPIDFTPESLASIAQ